VDPEPVWTLWGREEPLSPAGNQRSHHYTGLGRGCYTLKFATMETFKQQNALFVQGPFVQQDN
jgi:hypothetical protein